MDLERQYFTKPLGVKDIGGLPDIVSAEESGRDQAPETEELALTAETEIHAVVEATTNIVDGIRNSFKGFR